MQTWYTRPKGLGSVGDCGGKLRKALLQPGPGAALRIMQGEASNWAATAHPIHPMCRVLSQAY